MINTKELNISIYGAYPEQNTSWIKLATKLYSLRKELKNLSQYEKIVSEQLQLLSRNESARGGNFLFNKIERSGAVNYKDVPELKGIDLNPYRKGTVNSWLLKKINA